MKSKRRAFTLIEMIVVVGVIVILVAILAASLRTPRGRAHQVVCMKNLKEISTAALDYANQHNSYPAGWVDANTRWMDLIENRIDKGSKVYRCPADTQQAQVTDDPDGMILSYGINRFEFAVAAPRDAAEYTFFNGVKKYRVKRPSEVILFADCTPGLFYCGDPVPAAVFSDPVDDVDYRHLNDGFCAAFCDGSAGKLTTTIKEQWSAAAKEDWP